MIYSNESLKGTPLGIHEKDPHKRSLVVSLTQLSPTCPQIYLTYAALDYFEASPIPIGIDQWMGDISFRSARTFCSLPTTEIKSFPFASASFSKFSISVGKENGGEVFIGECAYEADRSGACIAFLEERVNKPL